MQSVWLTLFAEHNINNDKTFLSGNFLVMAYLSLSVCERIEAF